MRIFLWSSLTIGIIFRVSLSCTGHNFDLESYWIVSDAFLNNRSVYAETSRYNYGPIWFVCLGILRFGARLVQVDHIAYLHVLVAALLALVDSVITLLLRDRFGTGAAVFFILNPISVLITGYHSQFDNSAVLLGFLGCLCIEQSRAINSPRASLGLVLIGLSLATKHILILFPLWLCLLHRFSPAGRRFRVLAIPYTVFAISFLPFALESQSLRGIIENVLRYRGIYTTGLLPEALNLMARFELLDASTVYYLSKLLFLTVLIGAGVLWTFRRGLAREVDLLLVYLLTLVVFSSSAATQYLAIPLIAVARYYRFAPAWIYSATAAWLLLTSPVGVLEGSFLDGRFPRFISYRQTQIWLLLLLGFVWLKGCQGGNSRKTVLRENSGTN